MPPIEGLSIQGRNRILRIDRIDSHTVRVRVHHPVSGEGRTADVPLQQLRDAIDSICSGLDIRLNSLDGSMMAEFSASQLAKRHDRPGWSSVWVRPHKLDGSQRGGNGWFINVQNPALQTLINQMAI